MILGHAGDINILPAIVVEIADGDTHIVAISRQPDLLRDVREGSIMVVMEQAVVVFGRIFLEGWNRRPVNEEDVRVPVVVVIDQTHPGDHRLRLVLVGSRTAVGHEIYARPGGDVFKPDAGAAVCLNRNLDRNGEGNDRPDGKHQPKHCRNSV